MSKPYNLVLFLIALVITAACAKSHDVQQSDPRKELVTELLDALNSKVDGVLLSFINKNCDATTPAETRAQRLKGLIEQGAPFKLVRVIAGSGGVISAIVSDKNGEELGFQLILVDGSGLKIKAMRVGPPDDAGAAPPKDYSNWKDLQSLTEEIRADTKNPAMGVALIHDAKLQEAIAGTRKMDGKERVTADEPWSIGSIGKPICSTIIGRLIEMGKLRWEETLEEAFPDLPMNEGFKGATLEQIMHHRGGIPADPGMRRPDVERIVAGATDPTQIRLNYAKDILRRKPIAKPGEMFEYSNAGYALLGAVAEKVTGKPYERLVRDLVFAPLHLDHSYTGADKLPDARPSGHLRGPTGLQEANFTGPMEILYAPAGGGMFMSLSDLAKFGQMHLDGLLGKDGPLKSATIKRLHQGMPEGEPGGRQYACGWGIESFPGIETMHMHNGSNGTMRAQLSIFPKSHLVVASIANAGGESEPSPPLQEVIAIAQRMAKG